MNIFAWLLFGIVVGLFMYFLTPEKDSMKGNLIGMVLLGVIGSFMGGMTASIVFGVAIVHFNFLAFLLASAGALSLLFLRKSSKNA